jgi:hypothetical protein
MKEVDAHVIPFIQYSQERNDDGSGLWGGEGVSKNDHIRELWTMVELFCTL